MDAQMTGVELDGAVYTDLPLMRFLPCAGGPFHEQSFWVYPREQVLVRDLSDADARAYVEYVPAGMSIEGLIPPAFGTYRIEDGMLHWVDA